MAKVTVKVIPKSRREEVKIEQNVIKVWLRAAPERGRANKDLKLILAEKIGTSKNNVKILSGFSSRNKAVDIVGLTEDEIKKRLG